jgi:hypothetical protein
MRPARVAAAVLGLALSAGPSAAQWLSLAGTLSFVEHRVDAGFGLERTAGLVAGVAADVRVGTRVDLLGTLRSGTLRLRSAEGTDLDVAEIGVGASWWVRPWIAAQGSMTVRGYSADIARQRWGIMRLGAELHIPLAAGRIQGIARGAWLPLVWVNGLSRPSTAVAASVGTEYGGSRWSLAMVYELERYDFPPQGLMARFEQLSALTLQVRYH